MKLRYEFRKSQSNQIIFFLLERLSLQSRIVIKTNVKIQLNVQQTLFRISLLRHAMFEQNIHAGFFFIGPNLYLHDIHRCYLNQNRAKGTTI